MPRHNRVYRRGAQIVVVVDNVEHALSEPGFIEFMEQAIDVMQHLAAKVSRPAGLDLTLTYLCPTCGAAPGTGCTDKKTGRPTLMAHTRRQQIAARGAQHA